MASQSGPAGYNRIKAVCCSANVQESVPQRGVHFLVEGASQFARNRCRAKRKHLLENANDCEVAPEIEGMRHYHQVLAESNMGPDAVLSSTEADTFILAELTAPSEDRMGLRKSLKEDKCLDLTLDLKQGGYKV